MQAARKFECFCVEPSERWMFAGNLSGQIVAIDIDSFSVLKEVQAHAGTIIAMAAHPILPYIACLSMDRTVSVWMYDDRGNIRPHCAVSSRDIIPANDTEDICFVYSNAQTIGFHSTKRQIVTRSGNAGVLELEFKDDRSVSLLGCVRLHGYYDVITARYVHDSDLVLSGSANGELILSHQGEVIRKWQIGKRSIHWLEHVSGSEYLLASDEGLLARVDINDEKQPIIGPRFADDDFEHVSLNYNSGRVFASSFDRRIYELDPDTCVSKGVVFNAPFKCRWLKTLDRQPSILLVQCRNGGLYKLDVDKKQCLGILKDTPEALWTGVIDADGDILLAGEGELLLRLQIADVDRSSLQPIFAVDRLPLDLRHGSYTKRMDIHLSSGRLILGRTDGDVVIVEGSCSRTIANLGTAIRDLVVIPDRPEVLVACENGHGYKLNLDTGKTILSFSSPSGLPLWAIAYNPQSNLVAFLERYGSISILLASDFSPVLTGFDAGRAKRAKWLDANRLIFSHTEELHEVNVKTGEQHKLLKSPGNTIEDFIWDRGQNYLVLIAYTWLLGLYDFGSGQLLAAVPDQIDYSKGLMWIPQPTNGTTYPLDFITFGRSGTAHHFRIHNENIVALGPVSCELSNTKKWSNSVCQSEVLTPSAVSSNTRKR